MLEIHPGPLWNSILSSSYFPALKILFIGLNLQSSKHNQRGAINFWNSLRKRFSSSNECSMKTQIPPGLSTLWISLKTKRGSSTEHNMNVWTTTSFEFDSISFIFSALETISLTPSESSFSFLEICAKKVKTRLFCLNKLFLTSEEKI